MLFTHFCKDSYTCLACTRLSVIIEPEVHCNWLTSLWAVLENYLKTMNYQTAMPEWYLSCTYSPCHRFSVAEMLVKSDPSLLWPAVAHFCLAETQDCMPWDFAIQISLDSWSTLWAHMCTVHNLWYCNVMQSVPWPQTLLHSLWPLTMPFLSQCHSSPLISTQALHAFWSGSSHWRSVVDHSSDSLGHLHHSI